MKANGDCTSLHPAGQADINVYEKRFNPSYRREVLDAYLFFDLDEVRQLTGEWIEKYNSKIPDEALANRGASQWLNTDDGSDFIVD